MKTEMLRAPTRLAVTLLAVVALLVAGVGPAHAIDPLAKCLKISASLGAKCLTKASKILEEKVAPVAGFTPKLGLRGVAKINKSCNLEQARTLGFRDHIDIARQIDDGCDLFAYEINALVYSTAQVGLTPDQENCRFQMYKRLEKLRKIVTVAWGKKCTLAEYLGKGCDKTKRDSKIAKTRAKTEAAIEKICGSDFDVIATFGGATLQGRIATFVDTGVVRGRHWAQRIYPPNNLGPSGELGIYPVGIKTLNLEDTSRLNVPGDGPRPITTEIYYPSTDADVAGVPEDAAEILGLTLFSVPAFRDVAIAPGTHPVIMFSHGSTGTRIQSFFFASVLASHGYVVISGDHHGNTIPDVVAGIIDPDSATNRPLDVSFLIDEFTLFNSEPGNFFEATLDLSRIGMSGHSFGGYTSLALAGGSFALGTFTDTRIKAALPQAPAAWFFDPSFFSTITIPTLIIGGTIDETTPFADNQQFPFDNMVSGASVVGLAEIRNAGHFTFSSFCEIDPSLLAFLGGFEEACEPRHIPWRHAQDITMHLAVNFFDATLNGDAAALAALGPAVLATIDSEDLVYQSK